MLNAFSQFLWIRFGTALPSLPLTIVNSVHLSRHLGGYRREDGSVKIIGN